MNSDLLFDFKVDRENSTVHVVREFNADLDLVWDAWTKAELLDQWWAPKPFSAKTRYMNFENGGKRVYAMVSPEGMERWVVQQFSSIHPGTSFKMYSAFADKEENLELPGSDWALSFSEQNGLTRVSIIIVNESRERFERMIDMGFKEGFSMGLQQLDVLVAGLKK